MNATLSGYLLVFLGGGFGSMLRHGVNRVSATLSPGFPAGTMLVNLTGSFAIGALAAWLAWRGGDAQGTTRLLLATGLLGGFTTFSAFSLDAMLLWQRGAQLQAAGYVAGTLALSLLAVVAGAMLLRALLA